MVSSRSARGSLVALLLVLPFANCDCPDEVGQIREPQIEVQDDEGNKHTDADPWLTVDFGDVDDGQSATKVLKVANIGGAPLKIENVCLVSAATVEEATGDAPCILSADAPFLFPNIADTYNVNESVDLTVTFQPRQGGPQSLFLRIASNAQLEPVVAVQLVGRGTSGRLCADNAILDFGEVAIGASASQQITLTNCGVRPVTIDTFAWVQNPDDVFSVQIGGVDPVAPIGPLEEGDTLVLDVTFAPTEVRSYRDSLAGSVRLTTGAPYVAEYTVVLLGDGRTPPSCRVNVVPETVQFGAVAGTSTATQQLILQSVGECACTVDEITQPMPVEEGFFLADGAVPQLPVVLRGTRGCEGDPEGADSAPNLLTVEVSYTAPDRQNPEADQATMTVTTSDASEPTRTVNLEANGGGTPFCQLDVTPVGGGLFNQGAAGRYGVVSFGRVTIHFEKRLPIELTNSGNTDCTISSVEWDVAANTQANEFGLEHEDGTPVNLGSTSPITLGPGETQRYMAVFHPTHTIEGGIGNIFSFGSYSASNDTCGFLGPNTRCNGVRFVTTDTVTDTSGPMGNGTFDGVFSIGFSATPVEPAIDVIPGELDFGLVTLGCGSPEREVTVYNTGSGELIIGQPYAEPDTTPPTFTVAAQAPSFPHTIGPGGSMRMRVRYYANALGEVTGRIVIPTLEGGQEGPPMTVPLRGEGTTETEQTDIFDQFSDPKVDVLWVVDDSGSMSPFQQLLAANFPQFFTASNVAAADYHIAVTTTLTVDSACVPDLSGNTNCADHEMCGYYTSCPGNDRFLTPVTADPEAEFGCNVLVSDTANVSPDRPTSDSAEGGFKAARKFLEAPNRDDPAINGGFLRDDAKLHVIMVSDEPEQSEGPVDLYVDFFRNLKGFRNDSLVAVSAIGTPQGGCTLSDGTAIPDPGARYPELVNQMNGRFQSICDTDWTTMMGNLGLDSLGLKVEFFLSRAADSATLTVCVREGGAADPTCAPVSQTSDGAADGYFYDPGSNSIVFNPGSIPVRGARVEVHYETYCY